MNTLQGGGGGLSINQKTIGLISQSVKPPVAYGGTPLPLIQERYEGQRHYILGGRAMLEKAGKQEWIAKGVVSCTVSKA